MVKTYEFHLPMHHIREEEPKSQNDLHRPHNNKQSSHQNNQGSRYNLSK